MTFQQSCSLSTLQARLKVAAHQAEEESEETAENFLEGGIEIDEFLTNFMEKRTVREFFLKSCFPLVYELMVSAVLVCSFVTAEGPKRRSCSSASTHTGLFLSVTRARGRNSQRCHHREAWRVSCFHIGSPSISCCCFAGFMLYHPNAVIEAKTTGAESTRSKHWALWRSLNRMMALWS